MNEYESKLLELDMDLKISEHCLKEHCKADYGPGPWVILGVICYLIGLGVGLMVGL